MYVYTHTHSPIFSNGEAPQRAGRSNTVPCSPIYFSKHNILGTYDGNDVRQHVSLRHLVQTSQVSKTRSLDLASIRAAGTIRHQVHAKLSLGRLDGRVCGSWGNLVALGVQLKVMDQ